MECSATTRPWNAAATLQTVWFHIKHIEQLSRELLGHSSLASSRIVVLIGYFLLIHHHGINHCCCLLLALFCGMDSDVLWTSATSPWHHLELTALYGLLACLSSVDVVGINIPWYRSGVQSLVIIVISKTSPVLTRHILTRHRCRCFSAFDKLLTSNNSGQDLFKVSDDPQ
jgi:hypothetical protein